MTNAIPTPRRRYRFGGFAWLLLLGAGCGGGADVGYVTGTLFDDGAPAPEGTKVFFEQSGRGYIAVGQLDAEGGFSLNFRGERGIEPAKYVVFVGPPDSSLTPAEFGALKAKVNAEYRKRGEKPPASPDWVLPEVYYSPQTSPLRATVEVGPNQIDLSLDD